MSENLQPGYYRFEKKEFFSIMKSILSQQDVPFPEDLLVNFRQKTKSKIQW